jgi:hypothetical protein
MLRLLANGLYNKYMKWDKLKLTKNFSEDFINTIGSNIIISSDWIKQCGFPVKDILTDDNHDDLEYVYIGLNTYTSKVSIYKNKVLSYPKLKVFRM